MLSSNCNLRNDFDGRLDSVECELEPDLVVAFACAACCDVLAVLALSDAHLGTCNHGTSKGGA